MRKLLLLCAVYLLLVFPVVANAVSITADPMGTRSTADGTVTAADGWTNDFNGFELSWVITPTTVGITTSYSYQYTISGEGSTFLSKGLSHWILEVTNPSDIDDFTMTTAVATDRLPDGDPPTYQTLTESSNIPFEGPDTFESGKSNPDMLGNIYGIKWNTNGGEGIFGDNSDIVEFVITFTSLKDPVWGDFYAKNGAQQIKGQDKIWATAWNVGFGTDPNVNNTDNYTDFTNWIATPNGGGLPPLHVIPEPATMLLLGSGLIGFAVSGKKRFKKRNGQFV